MKFKRLLAIALSVMVMVTIGAASGVFAADGQNSENKGGTASYSDTEAKLVKYVQIPEGVDLTKEAMADKTFTFSFAAADPATGNQNVDYGVPKSVFESQNFSVTSGKISAMTDATSTADADTQNKVWTKSIADIFGDVNFNFPRAGEYTFTVTETATAATGWTYASNSYTLRLVVDNNKNIDDVTVANEAGEKVDPSDVVPGDNPGGATPAASNGGFTFTNLYKPTVTTHDEPENKNPDPDPTTPSDPTDIDKTTINEDVEGAFVLYKYVLGEYGDQTKPFDFKVTVTLPKNYKDFQLPEGWADGTQKTISIVHGGFSKFAELPVGTKITVQEVGPIAGYTQLLTTSKTTDAAAGVSDATATTAVTVVITEDGGYAICRNSFDDSSITPTGIIINNLPYILLILFALGGIVLFARKRRYQ